VSDLQGERLFHRRKDKVRPLMTKKEGDRGKSVLRGRGKKDIRGSLPALQGTKTRPE